MDSGHRVKTIEDFLGFYQGGVIPIVDDASESDDTGIYGVYIRHFLLCNRDGCKEATLENGMFEGKHVRVDVYRGDSFLRVDKHSRGDLVRGRVQGIYNHWAIQKLVPEYPKVYIAFAHRHEFIRISDARLDLSTEEKLQHAEWTLSKLYQLFDALRGKVAFLSLPGILYYQKKDGTAGIYFRHPENLRVVGGCTTTHAYSCTFETKEISASGDDVRVLLLSMIAHLYKKHQHPVYGKYIQRVHATMYADLQYIGDLHLCYSSYLRQTPPPLTWKEMQP